MTETSYDSESADDAQKAILTHLFDAGWLNKTYESNERLMLQWTEVGQKKLPILQSLLSEIGSGNWTPKQKVLGLTMLYLSNHVGWDNNGVTNLGPALPDSRS